MPRVSYLLTALVLAIVSDHSFAADAKDAKKVAPSASAKQNSTSFEAQVAPFLKQYCTNCHSGTKPKADLNLTSFTDEASVVRARKVWTRVKENLESGEMPPEDKPQPTDKEVEAINAWIDATLAKVDCAKESDPGRVTIRRLNRAEYNNTIRDLVGVDFQPAEDFPSDDVGYGFDNIGDVLTLPPLLFENYLQAAEKIAEQAIVDVAAGGNGPVKTFEVEDLGPKAGGDIYKEFGRILASQGTILAEHTLSRDAEYIVRIRAFGQQAGPEPTKMGLLVENRPLKAFVVAAVEKEPKVYEARVKLKKGKRVFGVSFLNDYYNEKDPDPTKRDRNLVVDYVEIQGPVISKDSPLPESHKRIIFKTPSKTNRDEVTREIVEKFATRAFRRPLAPGETARLVKFVDLAQQNGDSFERGIQLAVEAVLVSPQFLFRVELDHRPRTGRYDPKKAAEAFLINDFELASRLSYFLWSSMPDEELYKLAVLGKLREVDNLDKQVRRMLRDPKAKALVENFADQWLQIRNLKTVNPDKSRFPTFDDALRSAMQKETELFFEAIVREDRSVLELLDADFTFVNDRLAKHYGMKDVKGEAFRRVALKGDERGGILTHASILTVTSNPTRTSPVKRGKWILEQILGTPPPPPPGEVPPLDKDVKLTGTLRQRMEQHRVNPACASCHAKMDPLGFGFENYDAIGAWRTKDGDQPVDASGVLPSGQSFKGPKALKAILKTREKDFLRCLTEKMLTYALGRGIEYYDTCAMDKIVDGTARNTYCFSQLILEIVKSDPFQKRKGRG